MKGMFNYVIFAAMAFIVFIITKNDLQKITGMIFISAIYIVNAIENIKGD